MNFEQRARKARGRGQTVRAAVLLIEGLKRNPKARSALDLLIDIYADDLDSAGLGYDLGSAISRQSDARAIFKRLLERLHAQEKDSMGQELVSAAAESGIALAWPPPKQPEPADLAENAPVEPAEPPEPAEPAEPAEPVEPAEPAESAPPVSHADSAVAEDVPIRRPEPAPEPLSSDEPAIEHTTAPRRSESTPTEVDPTPKKRPERARSDDEPREKASTKPINEPAPQRPPTPESPGEPSEGSADEKAHSRKMLALAAGVVLVLAALAAYLVWGSGAGAKSIAEVDRHIERIDPSNQAEVEALFSKQGSLSALLAERRAFLRAVRAAEWGDASATVASQKSAWGIAAAAASFALQSKFEQALSAAARLERKYPDALASHWALGFVAEARGRFAAAVRHYRLGQERFPDFAPMITGQLRVHTRQGRAATVDRLQERLSELSEENPYAKMALAIPELDDLAPRSPSSDRTPAPNEAKPDQPNQAQSNQAQPNQGHPNQGHPNQGQPNQGQTEPDQAEQDQAKQDQPKQDQQAAPSPKTSESSYDEPEFVRAVSQLRRSLDAIHRADFALALERADMALELEPQLGPALLVAGVLRMAAMDMDNALVAFTRLAQLPSLDMRYRWMLQVAAPRALIAIGRADLAYQFVPPVKSAGSVAPRDLAEEGRALPEPIVPLLSVETRAAKEPLAQQALLARADVLSLLGYATAASETLDLLDGIDGVAHDVGLRRTLTAIRRGSRRSASGAVRALGDHPEGLTASAVLAYYTGRYDDGIEDARRALVEHQGPDDIITLRYLTLSLTADGRGREAMVVLNEAKVPVFDQPQIDALRMRVLARLAPKDNTSTATYETFEKMKVTSIDRQMDLADVAFWHKNFDDARRWTDEVLDVAPELPEANWLRGLLAQVADKEDEAERFFRDAWRDGTDDPRLLVELGRIYLGLGEARRAQSVFYRALLKDRTNLEAIHGLGQSYMVYSRRIGQRDLARILGSYTGSKSYLAQATAILKWLAILNGSREGKAKGLKYLEQAGTMVGDSADLLIERARFHEARDEVSEARKLYARALEKNATLAAARAGLARMALAEGDEAVARVQLERYLALAPEGEDAAWAREELEKLSKAAPPSQVPSQE